jgi:hypothetical protein
MSMPLQLHGLRATLLHSTVSFNQAKSNNLKLLLTIFMLIIDTGTYYFSQSSSSGGASFINQAQAGVFRPGPPYQGDWFCVAPIVTQWNQTKVVFWAASSNTGCCSQSGVTCWLRFNSPGSAAISASVKPLRYFEYFETARFASCSKLAVNTSNSAQSLCSLPAVYLDVASSSTAEDTMAHNLQSGLLLTGLTAIVWPCPIYLFVKLFSN